MIRSDSVGVLSAKSHQRCFCQRGRLWVSVYTSVPLGHAWHYTAQVNDTAV